MASHLSEIWFIAQFPIWYGLAGFKCPLEVDDLGGYELILNARSDRVWCDAFMCYYNVSGLFCHLILNSA